MIDNQMKRLGLLERLFWPVVHESLKISHLTGKSVRVAYMPSQNVINVRRG